MKAALKQTNRGKACGADDVSVHLLRADDEGNGQVLIEPFSVVWDTEHRSSWSKGLIIKILKRVGHAGVRQLEGSDATTGHQ